MEDEEVRDLKVGDTVYIPLTITEIDEELMAEEDKMIIKHKDRPFKVKFTRWNIWLTWNDLKKTVKLDGS